MGKKLDVINFARGFAIFTIVVMHLLAFLPLPDFLAKAVRFGGAGVHIFFLCSGFGLYYSALCKPLDYPAFLKRRFFRLYLPYFLAILLWSLYLFLRSHSFSLQVVASHLLLYKMFDANLDISLCYYYWFISTIVQFYICWPLIVKLMEQRYGLAVAVALSLAWAALVGILKLEESRNWSCFFLQYLWEFCLGMHLATIAPALEERIKKLPYWMLLMGIVCSVPITFFMGVYGGPLTLFNDLPSMLGYASCLLLVYKIGLAPVNSFFKFTNTIGYEWYLTHGLAIMLVENVFPSLPAPIQIALSFVCSYGLAYLFSFLTVDRSSWQHRLAYETKN